MSPHEDTKLTWVSLLWEKAKKIGYAQPERKKASGQPIFGRPVPKGSLKKNREGLLTRACSDKIRGNDFKLEESRFRLDI